MLREDVGSIKSSFTTWTGRGLPVHQGSVKFFDNEIILSNQVIFTITVLLVRTVAYVLMVVCAYAYYCMFNCPLHSVILAYSKENQVFIER